MKRLTMIIIAVALPFTGLAGCGFPGSSTITVTADLDNVSGLYEGNDVSVLGMPVGAVESIVPRGDHMQVTLSIDSGIQLPADVRVVTVSPSLVTNRHVELTPPYRGEGPVLEDGAHVPIERTKTPVEIDRLIAAVDELAVSFAGPGNGEGPIADTLDLTSRVLGGNGERMGAALDDLSRMLEIGGANSDSLQRLIVALSEVTHLAAENDTQVREFGSGMEQVLGQAATEADRIGRIIPQINDVAATLAALIADNESRYPELLENLRQLTTQMYEHGRELRETVDVAPMLLENLYLASVPGTGEMRAHLLTDRGVLDTELINEFCIRIQMKSEGCRTGRVMDFGPDFGITDALLGLTQ